MQQKQIPKAATQKSIASHKFAFQSQGHLRANSAKIKTKVSIEILDGSLKIRSRKSMMGKFMQPIQMQYRIAPGEIFPHSNPKWQKIERVINGQAREREEKRIADFSSKIPLVIERIIDKPGLIFQQLEKPFSNKSNGHEVKIYNRRVIIETFPEIGARLMGRRESKHYSMMGPNAIQSKILQLQ